MSTYPLGIDNPIKIKGVVGSHKWALYWRETMEMIAEFNDQYSAMQYRYYILQQEANL